MKCLKPPMPVGGDGFVEFGDEAWSYYYSHPTLDVQGSLHLPGFPILGEDIEGYAWIDHQWANLTTDAITWEWLSIQLDDEREIMVADVWVNGVPLGSFSGGLNYYYDGCSLEILEGYELVPLACYLDPVTEKRFSTEWWVTEPTMAIDLIVDPVFDHQIMRIGANQIFPTCFREGACTVSGIIAGEPVSGTAYAEVTNPFCAPGGVDDADYTTTGPFLEQNRPNPFEPATEIQFGLPSAQQVTLEVYNIEGRLVATVADGEHAAGLHRVKWNGRDSEGRRLPAGVYFCRLMTADEVLTGKMLMVK